MDKRDQNTMCMNVGFGPETCLPVLKKRDVPRFFLYTPYFPAKGRVGRNPSFGHLGLTGENHKKNQLTGGIVNRMHL
jgi:hypothetical protein